MTLCYENDSELYTVRYSVDVFQSVMLLHIKINNNLLIITYNDVRLSGTYSTPRKVILQSNTLVQCYMNNKRSLCLH